MLNSPTHRLPKEWQAEEQNVIHLPDITTTTIPPKSDTGSAGRVTANIATSRTTRTTRHTLLRNENGRERRERRRVEEEQREAELELDALRARREAYYSRPERERQRGAQRMAQEVVVEGESKSRSGHRVRRDGTVKRKKVQRAAVDDDRSDDYVYGRPKSGGVVEEVTIKRSSAKKRSEEGGSSSRTAQSPFSGSRSASLRETPKLSR